MSPLNNEQKQLLFDYCLGITSEYETAEAEALVASNPEAAEIHARLKAALSPLDSYQLEPCPGKLVEGVIRRAGNIADTGRVRLQQVLAAEERQTVSAKSSFWRNFNFGKIAAMAAVILLVAGVLLPSLSVARQKYWQQRCQKQLDDIFQGLSNYMADYDGQPPTVAMKAGAPWWMVGYQGQENLSNTRPIWLLAKGGYVKPNSFVCPCRSQGRVLQIDISQLPNYNDFPSKNYITYSIRIRRPDMPCALGREPIIADANPIFDSVENPPVNASGEFRVKLNDTLLKVNSRNHKAQGQNVLFGDGSVTFMRVRHIGTSRDDIFTLQQMRPGFEVKGYELPTCESDSFLVP